MNGMKGCLFNGWSSNYGICLLCSVGIAPSLAMLWLMTIRFLRFLPALLEFEFSVKKPTSHFYRWGQMWTNGSFLQVLWRSFIDVSPPGHFIYSIRVMSFTSHMYYGEFYSLLLQFGGTWFRGRDSFDDFFPPQSDISNHPPSRDIAHVLNDWCIYTSNRWRRIACVFGCWKGQDSSYVCMHNVGTCFIDRTLAG